MHLAYITTGYPYVSHTFIQNEVIQLRALGARVDTYALTQAPATECRTDADREAYATTSALRPISVARYLMAHARSLAFRPTAYWRAIRGAAALAGWSPADIARHGAYFLQAVVLADEITSSGAEHVHAHFANVSADLAMLASVAAGGELGWSFTLHGPREFSDVTRFRLAEKARAADFVVCISEFARSQLMAITDVSCWSKFHVVRCGVDVSRFAPSTPPSESGVPLTLVCVGRLVPEKAQSVLVRAVGLLVSRGRTVNLDLVGDGPMRKDLEALVRDLGLQDRVRFLGARPPADVISVLRESAVFCLPSFAEGIPVVLMEAMAMEVPPVACHVAGIPELIESGSNGLLVAPGSVVALTDALERLLGDEWLRLELGAAARRRVEADYELVANATLLRDLYANELYARQRPQPHPVL